MRLWVDALPGVRASGVREGTHDTRVYFVRRVIKGRCALPTLHTQVIYPLNPSFLECSLCSVDIVNLFSSAVFLPPTPLRRSAHPPLHHRKLGKSLISRNTTKLYTHDVFLGRQSQSSQGRVLAEALFEFQRSEREWYVPTHPFVPLAICPCYVIPEVYNPMEVDLRKLGARRCLRWGFGKLRHSDVTA